ncbi:MAG TPA: hypothetical protein VMR97_02865 [Acidimicrobiales bacterium]|nr:hypothetical protein [Acidimicrobiales bacterium]
MSNQQSKVVVAGSYPPVPGRAAAATLAAVGRTLARSEGVVVVSPRPSAAHLHASMTGIGAARTLWRLGSSTGADQVVLCLEEGVPFPGGSRPWRTRAEASLVRAALRRYRKVTLLLGSRPDLVAFELRCLRRAAHEVVVASEEERALVAEVAGVPEALVAVEVLPAHARGGIREPATLVTPLGPRETDPRERDRLLAVRIERAAYHAEHAAARAAHLVMGDHAHRLGRPLRRVAEPLRSAVHRRARST